MKQFFVQTSLAPCSSKVSTKLFLVKYLETQTQPTINVSYTATVTLAHLLVLVKVAISTVRLATSVKAILARKIRLL